MDLRLYMRALWRFRFLVTLGVLLAVALGFLSYARVSFAGGKPTVSYRQSVVYQASERLLLTERGFPEGRATLPVVVTKAGVASAFADPSRFAGLATYYANLANSDVVRALVRKRLGRTQGGRTRGAYVAGPVIVNFGTASVQPILEFDGQAQTPLDAIRFADLSSVTFRSYLARQQEAASIPKEQRVVVTVLNRAAKVSVAVPRKKTIPVIVFMAVIGATLALAFLLENLRPRIKSLDVRESEPESIEARRSTA